MTPTTVIHKTCIGCGNSFHYEARYQSNRVFCSKSCRLHIWNKKQRKNKSELVRSQARKYYAEHREKRLASMKRYSERNIEKKRQKAKQYYADNKKQIRAKALAWHRANRDSHNVKLRLQGQKARMLYPWRKLMHAAKQRARLKKLPYTLTKEWALERWTGKCEVTGLPFKLGLMGTGPQVWSPSIDRIDPKIGYTPSNCRFVLVAVNIFKMTGTDADMLEMAKAIVNNIKISS